VNYRKILCIIGLLAAISCLENCSQIDENIIPGSINKNSFSATEATTIQGSMKVNQLKTRDLTVQGSAKFGPKAGKVDGDLVVQGKLEAKNLEVSGNTTVQGSAELEGSTFKGSLELSSLSKIGTTTIHGDLLVRGKKLIIKSGLTVKGVVIFMNEPGEISVEGPKENIHLDKGIRNGKMETTTDSSSEPPIHF
jgi:hypothetical protein